jgi:hypothetical protein
MLKPGPNFKMSKANKFVLANIIDPHRRGEIKRGLIDAQLSSEIRVKPEKSRGSGGPRTTGERSSVAE